jgi:hypothetical protein
VDNHPPVSVEELKKVMVACSRKHESLIKDATMGNVNFQKYVMAKVDIIWFRGI